MKEKTDNSDNINFNPQRADWIQMCGDMIAVAVNRAKGPATLIKITQASNVFQMYVFYFPIIGPVYKQKQVSATNPSEGHSNAC